MLRPRTLLLSCLVLSSSLYACSDSKSSKSGDSDSDAGAQGDAAAGDSAVPAGKIKVAGIVRDAEMVKAVDAAALATESGATDTSGKDGTFELLATESDLDLTVGRKSFATTYKPLPSGGGSMEVYLKSIDESLEFRGDEGVTVTLPSGVKLEIPKDAVTDAEGKAVPGLLNLEFAAVDGTSPSEAAALPGDASAERKDGKAGRLSMSDGVSIRVFDAENKELTVRKDADVVAEIPARKDADAQIGVYSYDTKERTWKEEGTAELSMNGEDKAVYRADIEHLSWWSLGRFFDTLTCVRACVEDGDGKAVPGAQVWIVGKTQAGVSTFYTDETGCGAGDTIADVDVVMVAQAEQVVSASKTVSLGNVNASAGTDPGACQNAGTFTLGADASCALCEGSGPTTGQTVTGKVVDGSGVVVPNVEVLINGVAATSNAQGQFELAGVSVPYDLTIIEEVDTDRRVIIYLDIERLDPVVRVGRTAQHRASGSGVISGGIGFPIPADVTTEISFRAPGLVSSFSDRQNPGDNAGWMTPGDSVAWSGSPTISGTLFAIQYHSTELLFTGIASKDVTFQSGESLNSPTSDLALSSVSTREVEVTSTLPQGANLTYYTLGIGSWLRSESTPPATFLVTVPNDLPALFPAKLTLNATIGTRTVNHTEDIGADATTLTAQVPTPIAGLAPTSTSPILPADRTFRFVPQANSLTTVSLSWDNYDPDSGTGAYHSTTVYTDGDEIDLDEIVSLGADVSSGQTVSYALYAVNDAINLEAFLDENRTSSGVRTLSYEQSFDLSLP